MSSEASMLIIRAGSDVHRLKVPRGQSVREAMDATQLRVRAACGGTGSCGACTVRVLSGAVAPPTVADYQKLTAAERARGLRLACQLRLAGDAEVAVDDAAPRSVWRSIAAENLPAQEGGQAAPARHVYGLAVDLGTTHIRLALWHRHSGQRIATRCGPNPQADFGADVLNRLGAARRDPAIRRELEKRVRTAILDALRDILARDVGEVTPMLAEIGRLVIVGNTAMLALLTGRGGDELLQPDNWQRAVDCQGFDAAWRDAWQLPNAEFLVPPPLAGFIGSDLTADLVATGLVDGPPGSLLLDVGTNTEIALWDGKRLHVTSVPGGPAFEAGGISRGMPAEPGAICRVRTDADGAFTCDTIGGGAARGICGSGLVDAIAALLASGKLKASGRLVAPVAAEGIELEPGNPRSAIYGRDIDAFQRAKAATAAAVEVLVARAGLAWTDLQRICLCGAFGRTLDVVNSRCVGLLPAGDAPIELFGEAALGGSERALLAEDGAAVFHGPLTALTPVNMSLVIEYEDRYVDHLRLRPFAAR
jgi:uncharacterized 2Fe-2S/4Fe-4S cluster protein (DUF4445 family)